MTPSQISATIIVIMAVGLAMNGQFWTTLIAVVAVCTILKGC